MQRKTVNALRILALVVVISSIALFAPVQALFIYLAPQGEDIQTELDRAIDSGIAGMIVHVNAGRGTLPQSYAAGLHNRQTQQPAQTDALFKIASVSKLYVAAAVTRLAANGQLDPDASLLKYLPQQAARITNAGDISLRMLVQHRSGIANYTDDPAFNWFEPFDEDSVTKQSLALIYDKPALFDPGTDYAYSNTNYLLLGRIMDKTLGYSYRDYIQQEFLQPLGLHQTFGVLSEPLLPSLMSGYVSGYDDDLKHLAFMSPAGAMVATAADVAVFLRALNDGSLLTQEEQALYNSLYVNSHDGWLPGYLSFARYDESSDTVVVMFASTSGDDPWLICDIIYRRILKVVDQRRQTVNTGQE